MTLVAAPTFFGCGSLKAWLLAPIMLCCGLLPTAALAQGGPNAPPPPVTVTKPVVKDIMEWDEFIGRFDAVDAVEIRARVSGYIDRIHFKDGSMVKAGDPLFTIDQRPYRLAAEQSETAVISAQSRLEFASNDLERAEALRKNGNITEQLLDQRRSPRNTRAGPCRSPSS